MPTLTRYERRLAALETARVVARREGVVTLPPPSVAETREIIRMMAEAGMFAPQFDALHTPKLRELAQLVRHLEQEVQQEQQEQEGGMQDDTLSPQYHTELPTRSA